MAKSARGRRRLLSRQFRSNPYPIPSYRWEVSKKEDDSPKKLSPVIEKKDWEDATCSVCMDFPHNAVLLLCSSHDKGCRPYMCGTSYRHSNCLDQFKKAYTKAMPVHLHESEVENGHTIGLAMPGWPASSEKSEAVDLACPLCRGLVKGWTVVEPAREYLNSKKRSCMQENCSFTGTYRELRKHVRSEHPSARPRKVDPVLEQKWSTLESERERQDVMSTIRSTMPRSFVFGDYVVEMNNSDSETDDGEAGGDGGDFGSGVSRGIIYLLLRESARLMRLHGGDGLLEDEDRTGDVPRMSSVSAEVGTLYSSEGDDGSVPVLRQRRRAGVLRSEGGRRRRRRRSGGFGVS